MFGHIDGTAVGEIFEDRKHLRASGIHALTIDGIWGSQECAYSIVLSGGYEDDIDELDYISYTGQGGQGIMQSPEVREAANIPQDQVILTCVAFGWLDEEFVANSVVSRRRPIENVKRYFGFEE